MPLPDGLRFRDATSSDLPAIAALRDSVGWGAHEWALRAVVEGPHARCVTVIDADGEMIAVGSGISYGSLGFIGNMVVAEAWRRRGVGGAVLEAIIDFLEDRGCTRLELFATSAGRPLYARYGFALTGPSVTVQVPRTTSIRPGEVTIEEAAEAAALTDYDRPRFGGDRGPLLEMMARDPDRPLLLARDGAAIRGYLWLRPDGPRIGPFVADDPGIAAGLLVAAFERAPEAGELSLNVPMANELGVAWLRELGLILEPWEGRMARGAQIPRRDETIYSNLVGALG